MKKFYSLSFLLQLICIISFSQVKIDNLRTENLINPIGVDAAAPVFSWQLISAKRNVMQSAYEIKVSLNNSPVCLYRECTQLMC